MYKLTDLIKWNLAEAKIYLETGVQINDLEEQLLLRGEFDEFETLKTLRRPELIEVANSWPGPRTRYGVEGIIKDIETRKPRRKLIVQVDKSRSYINYNEAELSIVEEKNGEWAQVPSAMPGFLVANNKTELTLDEEIKRTAKYLSRKYFPDLFEKTMQPEKYVFSRYNIRSIEDVKGKKFAEIEIEIAKKNSNKTYNSAREYWDIEIIPKILDDKIRPAGKKLLLMEFMRNLTNTYADQAGDLNLQKIQKTVYTLQDMLTQAEKGPEKYRLKNRTEYLPIPKQKIVTDDETVKKAGIVYALDILPSVVLDPKIIEAMHNHEIALNFNKGIPFKAIVNTEIRCVH